MYRVTLGNGRVFTGLSMSGTYFVSRESVNAGMFSGWHGRCRIEYEGEDVESGMWTAGDYEYMELVDIMSNGRESYFALRRMSGEEVARMRDRADIEYLAMRGGVEL